MAASITVHLQISKRTQLSHFSTDFDETGIKNPWFTELFLIKGNNHQGCGPLMPCKGSFPGKRVSLGNIPAENGAWNILGQVS